MFNLYKVLLLQQWHNLSDPKMEYSLKTRIDFMVFSGFCLSHDSLKTPDETTMCRFRTKLIKANILDNLLQIVNAQLENHSLKVNISDGAIIDATLVEASVRSRAKPNVIVTDRNENDDISFFSGELKAIEQGDVEIDKDAKCGLRKAKLACLVIRSLLLLTVQMVI